MFSFLVIIHKLIIRNIFLHINKNRMYGCKLVLIGRYNPASRKCGSLCAEATSYFHLYTLKTEPNTVVNKLDVKYKTTDI
jgi:hypothetical protein